jgi:hypothetical protein
MRALGVMACSQNKANDIGRARALYICILSLRQEKGAWDLIFG